MAAKFRGKYTKAEPGPINRVAGSLAEVLADKRTKEAAASGQ
jgi:hypothetical protein